MTKYEPRQGAVAAKPDFLVSADWQRIFQGRPFTTPRFEHVENLEERAKQLAEWQKLHCTPLPLPVVAAKSCLTQPPEAEVLNPRTGELFLTRTPYPIGPWELLVNVACSPPRREWWPIAARARARMKEFRRFETQHGDGE